MRQVELIPGKPSSVLGFGCAPILGSVDASTARRAIECALDAGITHFDLARSYGFGEAESFVGKALGSRRGEVVIASKFGIRATHLARLLAPLKPLVRRLRRKKSGADRESPSVSTSGGPTVADRFHRRIPLTPEAMSRSLEESLRNLGTDHLDLFFIHEPPSAIPLLDDLCARAAELVAAGKIRAWGLAIGSSSLGIHRETLGRFDVLQIDNSPGASHYPDLLRTRPDRPNAFFSPLRGSAQTRLSPREVLQQLHADFPRSVILCSMFREKHIRANASALSR